MNTTSKAETPPLKDKCEGEEATVDEAEATKVIRGPDEAKEEHLEDTNCTMTTTYKYICTHLLQTPSQTLVRLNNYLLAVLPQ